MILQSQMTYAVRPRRLYNVLADFDGLEQLARDYGAEITPKDAGADDGAGRSWRVKFGYKGVTRDVVATVSDVTPHEGYLITAESDGIQVELQLRVVPQGDAEAAAHFTATLSARGLAARLMMQPLRLAHGRVEDKFHTRLVAFTRARLTQARKQSQASRDSRSS